jgi:hypothetical protein
MAVLCQVGVTSLIAECERFPSTRDVFLPTGSVDAGFESRPVSSVAAMPFQGHLNVRAPNDGFTALNSVAAISQSGRTGPVAYEGTEVQRVGPELLTLGGP